MLSEASDCPFVNLLKKETMATWFSVPLMEDVKSYGFCVIGFKKNITLYKEMGFLFFGVRQGCGDSPQTGQKKKRRGGGRF